MAGFFIQFLLKFVPVDPIDNESALVYVSCSKQKPH